MERGASLLNLMDDLSKQEENMSYFFEREKAKLCASSGHFKIGAKESCRDRSRPTRWDCIGSTIALVRVLRDQELMRWA